MLERLHGTLLEWIVDTAGVPPAAHLASVRKVAHQLLVRRGCCSVRTPTPRSQTLSHLPPPPPALRPHTRSGITSRCKMPAAAAAAAAGACLVVTTVLWPAQTLQVLWVVAKGARTRAGMLPEEKKMLTWMRHDRLGVATVAACTVMVSPIVAGGSGGHTRVRDGARRPEAGEHPAAAAIR